MKLPTLPLLLALSLTSHALLDDSFSLTNESLPLLLQDRAGSTGSTGAGSRPPGTGSTSGGRTGSQRTLPKLPKVPKSSLEKPTTGDDRKFSLGTYKITNQKRLFQSFEDPAEVNYFAQVFTFFAYSAEEAASPASPQEETYQNARGNDNPFQAAKQAYRDPSDNIPKLTGQAIRFERTFVNDDRSTTTTSTFRPSQPSAVCGAWSSLIDYCGGDDSGSGESATRCACSSGTYFVPEMYNSLAAGCANGFDADTEVCGDGEDSASDYLCSMRSSAAAHTTYCNSDVKTAYRFAQRANTARATTTSAAGSMEEESSSDEDSGEDTDASEPATTDAAESGGEDDEESMSGRASYDTTYTQPGRTIAPAPTLKPLPSSTTAAAATISTSASATSAVASSTTAAARSSASHLFVLSESAAHAWMAFAAAFFLLVQ